MAGLVESALRNLEPHCSGSSGSRVINVTYLGSDGSLETDHTGTASELCALVYGSYDSVISRTVCTQIVNLAIFTEVHSVRAGCDRAYCTPVLEQLCLYVTSNSFARDGCSGRDVYAIIVVNC